MFKQKNVRLVSTRTRGQFSSMDTKNSIKRQRILRTKVEFEILIKKRKIIFLHRCGNSNKQIRFGTIDEVTGDNHNEDLYCVA